MAEIKEALVPDIGDYSDVPVIEVLVSVGDTVSKDQSLVTLESDKATMEVPSSVAGVVKELKVKVGDVAVERAGQHLVAQREQCDHRFDDAGRAQGVAGPGLGRTGVQGAGEDRCHCGGFHAVVGRRGGAVQIQIAHCGRLQTGAVERTAHRQLRAQPLRMRRRHMVRVAGFAVAVQPQRGIRCGGRAFEQRKAAGLAQAQADPARVERLAHLRRHHLQRVEAEQHAAAQGVHAADQRRVDHIGLHQPRRLGEHLGAGRTGRGHGHARATQAGGVLHEVAQRMRGVHDRAIQILGEARAVGVVDQPRIRFFAGADAGGGGADDHRYPLGAVALRGGLHGLRHPVLLQCQPGQAVVAAIPRVQRIGQHNLFNAIDAPDPAGQQRLRPEIVATQAAASGGQRGGLGGKPGTECGGGSERGDGNRGHLGRMLRLAHDGLAGKKCGQYIDGARGSRGRRN